MVRSSWNPHRSFGELGPSRGSSMSIKYSGIFLCASVLIAHMNLASANDVRPSMFVTACRISKVNPELRNSMIGLRSGSILAYVKPTNVSVFTLYEINSGQLSRKIEGVTQRDIDGQEFVIEPIAAVTYTKPGSDGPFFEASGGVLSNAIAADAVSYFQGQLFDLVNDWVVVLSKAYHLKDCNIKFTRTNRYLNRPSH